MAVLCQKCDKKYYSVCDFCKYYQFNGEDVGGKHGPIYVDKGCCGFHFLRSDPGDGCEYFHCVHATNLNEKIIDRV